jgi:hypothetical protein
MLRVLFSRLGKPHIGSSNAFSFNVPSVRAVGSMTIDKGAGKTEKRVFTVNGGMGPRCEGMGSVNDIDLSQLYDDIRPAGRSLLGGPCAYARDGYIYTAPVGRFPANALGLCDMHGNVWEWCSDGYSNDYYKRTPVDDPQGDAGAANRVIRGGSWDFGPQRSACRRRRPPVHRSSYLGFRLARVQSVP